MKKDYIKDDLIIHWDSEKCTHAGVCVKSLPEVYSPGSRPWIKPENANVDQLTNQINNCPTGALAYSLQNNPKYGVFKDNKEKNRFELELQGHIAFLEYEISEDKIQFPHTKVPKELEGKGVGSRLVHRALLEAKKRNLKLVPICPFVIGYVKKHAHWQDLVLPE
jgi:predicted GNAT family acetyltransferase/uncharacterized Fe-S cluster protein YjdI